ncbi:hypothetical protein [Rosistilla oblonga]|uniref:type I-G CRISPR-associated protein, Cas3-extension family n=1 Tax=Rosistilla oblonga TaxID=2527990 RepID=UPI003A97FEEC
MTRVLDRSKLEMVGIDGANPLGFLAALGTLRALSIIYPDDQVQLAWKVIDGAWRPILSVAHDQLSPETLCGDLAECLASPPQMPLLESDELGDNLTIAPETFRWLGNRFLDEANRGDRHALASLDFLAAFGTDAAHQPHSKDRKLMQDTALRTMSGAGHQHFIKFMRAIIENTTADHLRRTLFNRWTYEDEGRGTNLRWDPIDDRRYAMRWKNPSSDAAVTMRGANRLAIEALPLFATAPIARQLETTGFRVRRGAFWSWPIWDQPLNLDVVRSTLQIAAISDLDTATKDNNLSALGIQTIYRSQRITVDKFRNFTPAQPVS